MGFLLGLKQFHLETGQWSLGLRAVWRKKKQKNRRGKNGAGLAAGGECGGGGAEKLGSPPLASSPEATCNGRRIEEREHRTAGGEARKGGTRTYKTSRQIVMA
uniref:Uncharacterized protein n=1 Tax=Leersia perrieri TaxID=77586 RepID=A0A0D9WSG0_9ORYZ